MTTDDVNLGEAGEKARLRVQLQQAQEKRDNLEARFCEGHADIKMVPVSLAKDCIVCRAGRLERQLQQAKDELGRQKQFALEQVDMAAKLMFEAARLRIQRDAAIEQAEVAETLAETRLEHGLWALDIAKGALASGSTTVTGLPSAEAQGKGGY